MRRLVGVLAIVLLLDRHVQVRARLAKLLMRVYMRLPKLLLVLVLQRMSRADQRCRRRPGR